MKPTSNYSRVLSRLPVLCSILLLTLGSTLFAQTNAPAAVDPRVDELQKQMKDLDSKMNRLLGLLEGKTQTTPSGFTSGGLPAAASGPTPVAVSKTKMPGAILDFWLMDGASKDIPASPALVTLRDTTQPFGFGNCLEQPEIAAYKQKYLGFRWRGLVQVEKAGQYLVVLDFRTGDQGPYGTSYAAPLPLNTKFTLAGTDVFSGAVQIQGKKFVEAKTATVDLQPGFYEFSFWATPTVFSAGDVPYYPTISVALKLKGTNDSAPVVIGADRISHYE